MPRILGGLAIIAAALSEICSFFPLMGFRDVVIYGAKIVGLVAAVFAGGCGVFILLDGQVLTSGRRSLRQSLSAQGRRWRESVSARC